MDYVGAIIGVLGTILGGVLSYAAFHRNSKKDSESEGKEAGTMLTEIGYIKGGIDRIERKQDAQDARYIGMAERMSAVEGSAKSAHHRIDRLEGREVREDGECPPAKARRGGGSSKNGRSRYGALQRGISPFQSSSFMPSSISTTNRP